MTVVEEQVDNDITATGKRVRPGFEAILKALTEGRVQVVIAWDMYRLSRNGRDTLRLLEAGRAANATLAFVRGSDLNLASADGRTMAGILASIAQGEVDKMGERQRRASLQAAEQGRRRAGRRAFGYGVQVGTEAATGKPIVDYDQLHPEEAPALREAYEAILAGVRRGSLARQLNEQGLFPPQGHRDGTASRWTSQGLRTVLTNPRNAGLRSHVTEQLLSSMTAERARIEGIVGPAVWPAIVDEQTWRLVVAKITQSDGTRAGRSPQRFLTGVALCAACGATVHSGTNAPGVPNYRCSADYGHLSPRSEPIDDYVNEFMVEFLTQPDLGGVIHNNEFAEVGELRNRMNELRARLDDQAALHAAGEIDTGQLRAGSALLRKQLVSAEKRLAVLAGRSVLAVLANATDPAAVWGRLDIDRRRAIIDQLFVVRIASPGRGARRFKPETVEIRRQDVG
jgi:site-specific DNA recombinase